ncbi:MAG: ABC transporter permease [Anaerolineaceae bacterium]|nr:ABC transporter permease [Anaerolineaceae bacterium]
MNQNSTEKPEQSPVKPDTGKVLLEELTRPPEPQKGGWWRSARRVLLVPALAILTGLIFGAILMVLTTEEVYQAFGRSFGEGMSLAGRTVVESYGAMFAGSLGDPGRIITALGSGEPAAIRRAFNPFLESLVNATPYIFAGLAVALGFRSGLFNIGVEGQLFVGATASAFVGYAIKGLPGIIHMPLALLAGAVAGGVWGFIPGWLKAKTGAHEVINTIMLNWIAFRLTEYLLSGPMSRPDSGGLPITPLIEKSAEIPQFFQSPIRLHLGFFMALAVAWFIHWLLFKTTIGFEMRTVGANPHGARYAGMNITRSTVLAMTISGALAGVAGAVQVLAVNRSMAIGLSPGYGFDSIALALLGNSTPIGVVLSSILFGVLRNGATRMMVVSQIPIDIVSIIQALILAFVAAPAIIRTIYRIKIPKEAEQAVFVGSWGGK